MQPFHQSVAFLMVIMCIFVPIVPAQAAIIWSDDFSSGNLDDWNIGGLVMFENKTQAYWKGNAYIDNGFLTADDPQMDESALTRYTYLEHESHVKYGTWSFDWDAQDSFPRGQDTHIFGFVSNSSKFSERFNNQGILNDDPQYYVRLVFGTWGCSLESDWPEDNSSNTRVLLAQNLTPIPEKGWVHWDLGFFANKTITVHRDSELVIYQDMDDAFFEDFTTTKLFIYTGTSSNWDNIVVKDISVGGANPVALSSIIKTGAIVFGTIIAVFAVANFSRLTKRKVREFRKRGEIRRAQSLLRSFSDIFSPSQLSYLAVLGQTSYDKEEVRHKLQKDIPIELKNYRFLLHPVRLMIIKMLYQHFTMTAVDIKELTEISWGDYSSHISVLERKGYITVHKEFTEEGMKSTIVYLEEIGRTEYEKLISLLKTLLHDVNIDYLDSEYVNTQLYPEKSETMDDME